MIGVETVGLDFFEVAHIALKDARLIRLMRVLEESPRTASFWYLRRCEPKTIERITQATGLDLNRLAMIATSLKGIRDKTFVHMDKDGVFNPDTLYEAAGITGADIKLVIESMWAAMQMLYTEVLGKPLLHDVYTGDDIKNLANLRDRYSA